jgi:hypothetical protein
LPVVGLIANTFIFSKLLNDVKITSKEIKIKFEKDDVRFIRKINVL